MSDNRAAGPGGMATTDIKKRRLSALEDRAGKRQKKGQPAQPKVPSVTADLRGTAKRRPIAYRESLYNELEKERLTDPIGKALQFPVKMATQSMVFDTLVRIGKSDKDRNHKKIENEAAAIGPRSFVTLAKERRGRVIRTARDQKKGQTLMSNAKRKKLGFDPLQVHYTPELVQEINQVWRTTFENAMKSEKEVLPNRVNCVDLHGCVLRVEQCKYPSYTGLKGVLVKNSKLYLHLAVERLRKLPGSDRKESVVLLKAIAKSGSAFSYQTPYSEGGPPSVQVNFDGGSV